MRPCVRKPGYVCAGLGHENNGHLRKCRLRDQSAGTSHLCKTGLTGFTPSRVGLRSGQFEPAKQD